MQRYARQTVLPEIGPEGQERLKAASVLCIGAGGLGSPALQYLAAAGIGRIGIVDDDRVDYTNLQRQVLFRESDVGAWKAEIARDRLRALNSDIEIAAYVERFNTQNAHGFLQRYDIVLDGTDNFSSKFLINDACVQFARPMVFGAVSGFEARAAIFWSEFGPCYRCLYPQWPTQRILNCAQAGVLGVVAGIAGTVQALHVIKLALSGGSKRLEPEVGRLWLMDALTMQSKTLTIPKRMDCPVCSLPKTSIVLPDEISNCTPFQVEAIRSDQALQMLETAFFVDVRESSELYSQIPGALNLPLSQLLDNSKRDVDLPTDRPIIVYCQKGIRSLEASAYLRMRGYVRVVHLSGGLSGWTGPLMAVSRIK